MINHLQSLTENQVLSLVHIGLTLLFWLLSIASSLLMKYYPPKKINLNYGYKTARSMKNEENWQFSNTLAPKVMIKYYSIGGLVILIISLLICPFINIDNSIYFILGMILCFVVNLIIPIFIIEKRLKEFELSKENKQKPHLP